MNRNAPCPCGSGRKYKHCCGRGQPSAAASGVTPEALLQRASAMQASGQPREAEALYRQLLARRPGHPAALHGLAGIAVQAGDLDRALDMERRAVAAMPDNDLLRDALAQLHMMRGEMADARPLLEDLVARHPDRPAPRYNLALACQHLGDSTTAAGHYRELLSSHPEQAMALTNLGNIERDQGRHDVALDCYRRAHQAEPDDPLYRHNLAVALAAADRFEEATAQFRSLMERPDAGSGVAVEFALMQHRQGLSSQALETLERARERTPGDPELMLNRGVVLVALGRYRDAVTSYQSALDLRPGWVEAHFNLGLACRKLGRPQDAVNHLRQASAGQPDDAAILAALGSALRSSGRPAEACECLRKSLALEPERAEARSELGSALKDQGLASEALVAFEQALEAAPDDPAVFSNYLMTLNYPPDLDESGVLAEHRRFGQRFAAAIRTGPGSAGPKRRIGLVSADFRRHSVFYFLKPLVESIDRDRYELYGYSNHFYRDAITDWLEERFDHWRTIDGIDDDTVADWIRDDGVDLLLDLSGHSGRNRMTLFARGPAPRQASWLGYPNVTGLNSISARIVDGYTDPEGQNPDTGAERLIRLDGHFLCYTPHDIDREPCAPPCQRRGHVTFGSFNNLAKVNERVLDAWGEILCQMPDARLLLKSRALSDPGVGHRLTAEMETRGVKGERLVLHGREREREDHLARYDDVDIALDTFPYNGTTTTFEALWMGVPVICQAGDRHRARVSAGILQGLGLDEWVARDTADYVRKAVALAGDPDRLSQRRSSLRDLLRNSPLMDASGFARRFEAAIETLFEPVGE